MLGKTTRYSLIAAFGIATMLTPAYSAIIQEYTDAATFSALTDTTLITFNNLGISSDQTYYTSDGVSNSGVQFVGATNYFGYWTQLGLGTNGPMDWGTLATLRGPGGSDQHLRIILPAGITAIGMNVMTWDSISNTAGGTLTIKPPELALGPIVTATWNLGMGASPKAAGVSPTWWGFISDSPIAYLDISSDVGYVVLDNFQFGTKAVELPPDTGEVPEAATMILIGTGLAGFSMLRRFKFNQAA